MPLSSARRRAFDVVVTYDFGHWVGVDGAGAIVACLTAQNVSEADARAQSYEWLMRVYEEQMRLRNRLLARAPPRTHAYFITASPPEPDRRFDAQLPSARPHSPRFDQPASDLAWVGRYQATASGYGHQLYAKLNAVARRAFGCGDVVEVIDVEEALSYRIDGHGHDMLHWCLPGVPDWLIAVLFRFVLVDE